MRRLVMRNYFKSNSIINFTFFVTLIFILQFIKYFIINRIYNGVSLTDEFIRGFSFILFWVIPAIVYLKYFIKQSFYVYTRLNQYILKNLGIGIFISIILSAFFILIFKIKDINLSSYSIPLYLLFTVVIIYPLIEEFIFRGIILQFLENRMKFIVANLFTSILFLVPHFPQWIIRDMFFQLLLSRSTIYIIVMSLILGFVFKKTRSLYTSILLHSTYNYWALLATLNY
jgi:hypothetical protein